MDKHSRTGKQSSVEYVDAIIDEIRRRTPPDGRVVFLSGDFNIVHPGHLRILKFAEECGDFLVVGVTADGYGTTFFDQETRLHNVRSISSIDLAFPLPGRPEDLVARLRPDIVVKGREYAALDNPEQAVVAAYGGKLLFASGDVRFSSFDMLKEDILKVNHASIIRPQNFLRRHSFTFRDLDTIVGRFPSLKVVVIGDLIVDRYITCEPLGMSQEDPTIVVTPIADSMFVGGAGIVAAHVRKLGAEVQLFSAVGCDTNADFARERLEEYRVSFDFLSDDTRPTTIKTRYRASGKTLLRVNELRQHEISPEGCGVLIEKVRRALKGANLLVFSDFNYGCLPQPLVNEIMGLCKQNRIIVAADSQASSQIGDVSRFKGADLVTPTEREARLSCADFSSGLNILAQKLQAKVGCSHVIVTLGAEGLLIQTMPRDGDADPLVTDRLPAFNLMPKDPAVPATPSFRVPLWGWRWERRFGKPVIWGPSPRRVRLGASATCR